MTRFMRHRPILVVVALAVIVVVAAAFKVSLASATHVAPFVGAWAERQRGDEGADACGHRRQWCELRSVGLRRMLADGLRLGSLGRRPSNTPQSDATDGQLSIVWEFGFSRRTETLTLLPDGRLHNRASPSTSTALGRPDRWSDGYFHKTTAPAVFYTLAVGVAGAGRGKVTSSPAGLSCPTACSLEFQSGTSVTLTATPERGSKLAAWSGACTGKAATCTIAVGGDRTATAVFAPNPPCLVPVLKGRTLAGARRALTAANCRLAAVKRGYSRRVRPGRVISQAPAAGTKLRNGGRVSVVISRGPRR